MGDLTSQQGIRIGDPQPTVEDNLAEAEATARRLADTQGGAAIEELVGKTVTGGLIRTSSDASRIEMYEEAAGAGYSTPNMAWFLMHHGKEGGAAGILTTAYEDGSEAYTNLFGPLLNGKTNQPTISLGQVSSGDVSYIDLVAKQVRRGGVAVKLPIISTWGHPAANVTDHPAGSSYTQISDFAINLPGLEDGDIVNFGGSILSSAGGQAYFDAGAEFQTSDGTYKRRFISRCEAGRTATVRGQWAIPTGYAGDYRVVLWENHGGTADSTISILTWCTMAWAEVLR